MADVIVNLHNGGINIRANNAQEVLLILAAAEPYLLTKEDIKDLAETEAELVYAQINDEPVEGAPTESGLNANDIRNLLDEIYQREQEDVEEGEEE